MIALFKQLHYLRMSSEPTDLSAGLRSSYSRLWTVPDPVDSFVPLAEGMAGNRYSLKFFL